MKSKTNTLCSLLILSLIASSDDSKNEEEKKISQGITYKTEIYDNVKFNVIKINSENIKDYVFEIKNFEIPQRVNAKKEDAILGMNASFFREERIIGLVRSNNKNIHPYERIRGSGYLVISNGIANIKETMQDTSKHNLILQSHPLLSQSQGQNNFDDDQKSFRRAVAVDNENNLYFVSTQNNLLSKRITLKDFSDYIEKKDYKKALNMDAGRSLQISTKNTKKISMIGTRKVRNALYIKHK